MRRKVSNDSLPGSTSEHAPGGGLKVYDVYDPEGNYIGQVAYVGRKVATGTMYGGLKGHGIVRRNRKPLTILNIAFYQGGSIMRKKTIARRRAVLDVLRYSPFTTVEIEQITHLKPRHVARTLIKLQSEGLVRGSVNFKNRYVWTRTGRNE